MPFCESRSTRISQRIRGHSHSVTRQAMEWGSSSRARASSCSRTSSATRSASGVSVTMSSGSRAGPRAGAATRASTSASTPSRCAAETGKYSTPAASAARRPRRASGSTASATLARRSSTWSGPGPVDLVHRHQQRRRVGPAAPPRRARPRTCGRPGPTAAVASTTATTTSTSASARRPPRSAARPGRCGGGGARGVDEDDLGVVAVAGRRGCGGGWCWAAAR